MHLDQAVLRNKIVELLSDAETGRVSNAEGGHCLPQGDQFIDLSNLSIGVQTAGPALATELGEIVPKSAVAQGTWDKIVSELKG